MTQEYSLQFNEGEPIDATKLQKLVTFINEVNAKALKLPSGADIAGDVVASVMTTGVSKLYDIGFSGKAQKITVPFDKPLSNDPYSVIVTLESTSEDMDLVHYVQSADRQGFVLMVNRVAGVNVASGAAYTATRTFKVKVHYFAVAKPTIA
jgi:hypothetical protein